MIDDDPDVILAIRIPLEAVGYEFYSASNSTEGLEKVKEINPDLIILDVMMETATEGFQTSLKLRDHPPDSEYAALPRHAHLDADLGPHHHPASLCARRRLFAGGRLPGKVG